ncbi:MAG: GNAT family N-acetyltransferase [Bacteroidota bacterium]
MIEHITLRPAQAADVETLCEFWLALMHEHEAMDPRLVLSDDAGVRWKNDYMHWLEDKTCHMVVATGINGPVGYIRAHRMVELPVFAPVPEVYVDKVYVIPEARGQEIGTKLLASVTTWAEACGAARVRLRVLNANTKGIAFWEREGASAFYSTYTMDLNPKPDLEKKQETRRIGF